MQDNDTTRQENEVLQLLQDYPAPAADAAFFDQALVRAAHEGMRRQRKRWVLSGMGAAFAATIAVWLIGGLLLSEPQLPDATADIPGVTMALETPRTVNLVFASEMALDAATLTVTLPDGIELSGFPGQREITWETSLEEGRNLLPLTLIALTPAGGELLARLEHRDRDRTFRLRVDIG